MLDFDLLKDCYGCGACVNVCPRGAVHMTQAADGSYLPYGYFTTLNSSPSNSKTSPS